jgi:hypothetical protein
MEALKERIVSQDEFDALDELRRVRNLYTHSKPFMHKKVHRAPDEGDRQSSARDIGVILI